jgi:hypothetical protein
MPCSETPAEPVNLALAAFPVLPPDPTRRGLQRFHDFEATTGLQYPLSTLHQRRCRRPCKTRFRLAGSAFAGRALNPPGHDERFPATSVLLSRTCPDASWSHARRKFYDVHQATASPIALDALQQIAALFAIEATIRAQSPDRRAAVRQEQARPKLDQLRAFLQISLARISGKSTLANAIRYTLSRWTALTHYLADGRLEMSNNAAERGIRPLALGRKNYLFCGSDAGGQRAACLYTIIETAKMNGINPEAYLADVLARIADHPIRQIDALLPWRWTPSQTAGPDPTPNTAPSG